MNILRRVFLASFVLVFSTLFAAGSVEQEIRAMDAAWEEAFFTNDLAFFEGNLHSDFVWVHNHVSSMEEGKDVLLAMVGRKQKREAGAQIDELGSRTQRDVKVIMTENTAVTYGFLIKVHSKRYLANLEGASESVTYHFMRTYAKSDDQWLLLSNHTMEVPEE